ncbi:MAG: hypothetical protein GF317_20540 [Candidatus Lokiarchaeota archaeon]|nr:hypothetical protein [Candidatus Lokiarchaeota archaeon]
MLERDNTNIDIFWLKTESLENLKELPEHELVGSEIAVNLESALTHAIN